MSTSFDPGACPKPCGRLGVPPIELALVEGSLRLVEHHCQHEEASHAAADCLPPALLAFLHQRVRP